MNAVERTIRDVVIANRILALNKVVDAYGHVSIRHPERPDRFFLACSVSPAIVEMEDIVEFKLDGTPVNPEERRELYVERFIHCGGVLEPFRNVGVEHYDVCAFQVALVVLAANGAGEIVLRAHLVCFETLALRIHIASAHVVSPLGR